LCQLIHATRLAAKRSNEAATQAVLLYRFFKSERIKVSDNVRFRWQCGQERGQLLYPAAVLYASYPAAAAEKRMVLGMHGRIIQLSYMLALLCK